MMKVSSDTLGGMAKAPVIDAIRAQFTNFHISSASSSPVVAG